MHTAEIVLILFFFGFTNYTVVGQDRVVKIGYFWQIRSNFASSSLQYFCFRSDFSCNFVLVFIHERLMDTLIKEKVVLWADHDLLEVSIFYLDNAFMT